MKAKFCKQFEQNLRKTDKAVQALQIPQKGINSKNDVKSCMIHTTFNVVFITYLRYTLLRPQITQTIQRALIQDSIISYCLARTHQ